MTDPNIAAANAPRQKNLYPFVWCLGVLSGIGFLELAAHPSFTLFAQPFILIADIGLYSFMSWLLWDDLKLLFKVRMRKLAGVVGFRWSPMKPEVEAEARRLRML